MFKVNKVYAAIAQTQMVAICFYMLPFEKKYTSKQTNKTHATAFSYCFITDVQRSCITLFYTN